MKKFIILGLISLSFLFLGCPSGKPSGKPSEDPKCMDTATSKRLYNLSGKDSIQRCGTMGVLEKHMAKSTALKSRIETIEKQCQAFIASRKSGEITGLDTITIPTIVHVIYSKEEENICNQQIQSQIKVLNQDFTKTNSDIDQIPEEFKNSIANINMRFRLDSIIRVSSSRTEWGTDDQMKFSSNGGSNVITPEKALNIWVCNIGNDILGYAQFPGDNAVTDGIVISPQFFGTEGFVSPPFDQGRTTTHEVGHWLNLRHIWGDGDCSLDDFVEDTPLSNGPNFGCPQYPVLRCNSNDMTMNYMDYVDDVCMYMFSQGQKDRMRAVFAAGGPRESFIK